MIAHYPHRMADGIVCDRDHLRAPKQLWQSLPPVSRNVQFVTHIFWQAYEQVLPSKRHQPVSKDSGKTSYIERFNNTLR
jgi:IS1 family transposase